MKPGLEVSNGPYATNTARTRARLMTQGLSRRISPAVAETDADFDALIGRGMNNPHSLAKNRRSLGYIGGSVFANHDVAMTGAVPLEGPIALEALPDGFTTG